MPDIEPVDPPEPVQDPLEKKPRTIKKKAAAKKKSAKKLSANPAPAAITPADVPSPFRRSDLDALIARAKKASSLPDDAECFKPCVFLAENGLPKPTKLFAVQATGPGTVREEAEKVEAVDGADAINQYIALRQIKAAEVHRYAFKTFVREG